MRATLTLILFATLSFFPISAWACLHFPPNVAPKPVDQFLAVIHTGGQQTMVVALDFDLGSEASIAGVVLPVPSKPTSYGLAAPDFFAALDGWARPRPPEKRYLGAAPPGANTPRAVTLSKPVEVGPYVIQPIQSQDPDAVSEWLSENGLAAIEPIRLRWFVENGWTFLVTTLGPKVAGGKLAAGAGGLPPLRVTFPSEDVVVPLNFERPTAGRIHMRLYFATDRALEVRKWKGIDSREEVEYMRHSVGPTFVTTSAPEGLQQLLLEVGGTNTTEWSFRVVDHELMNYDAAYRHAYPSPLTPIRQHFVPPDPVVESPAEPEPPANPAPAASSCAVAHGAKAKSAALFTLLVLLLGRRRGRL